MLTYDTVPRTPPSRALSPVDPDVRYSLAPQDEFFDSVYLDSPGLNDAEDLIGSTRPLRVQRKVSPRIAGVGPAARRRRSAVCVPPSPRPTTLPTPPRFSRSNTASSTTSNPHQNISRIFLEASPTILTPVGTPKISLSAPESDDEDAKLEAIKERNWTPSTQSELHLNLGVDSYDKHAPGPSPPPSPTTSPTKRTFVTPPTRSNRSKDLPPSPITPTRAPPKAAKLLGATTPDTSKASKQAKKKGHFRPLPTQTLVEIERLFGEVPRKSKTKAMSSTLPSVHVHGEGRDGMGARNVGQGRVVRHQGQDGRMWLDVEEEQEFAWLMSEVFSIDPQPLPPSLLSDPLSDMRLEDREEKSWGMESFTSVLSLRRPPPITPPKSTLKSTKKQKHDKEESFMDLGGGTAYTAIPSPPSTCSPVQKCRFDTTETAQLWSSEALRQICSVKPALSRSDSSESTSTLESGSSTGSPRKLKIRPPPLTLSTSAPRSNLPIISTTPSATYPKSSDRRSRTVLSDASAQHNRPLSQGVQTPFVRPRRAPVPPGSHTLPPLPPLPTLPSLPSIPSLPTLPTQSSPSSLQISVSDTSLHHEISYVEPETPTEPVNPSPHKRVLSGGAAAASAAVAGAKQGVNGVKSGGAWLKKVVRPRAGSRI